MRDQSVERTATAVLAALRSGGGAEAVVRLVEPELLDETLRVLGDYDQEILIGLLQEMVGEQQQQQRAGAGPQLRSVHP